VTIVNIFYLGVMRLYFSSV